MARSLFRLAAEIWRALDGVGDGLAFAVRHAARVTRSPCSPVRMTERVRLMSTVVFEADCRQVAAATRVLTGEPGPDRVVPVDEIRSYAERIRGARHVTLERTCHEGTVVPGRRRKTVEHIGRL